MSALARLALLALGWVFVVVGAVGLAVPVLPTTPFFLLAAACFLRSSERMHRWLSEHPLFGRDLSSYQAGQGLRKRSKVVAVAMLWAGTIVSVALFVPLFVVDLLLLAIATIVTVHIARLPTAPPG